MPIIMKDGIAYSSGSQTQEMKLAEYLALDPSEISNDTIYFITDTNEDLNQAFNGGFVVNLTLVNENSFTVDAEYANILKEYRQGNTIWFAESSQGLKIPVLQVTDEYAYASMIFNTIDDPKMATLTLHSNGQGYIQYGDVAYNKEQVDFVLDETGKITGYRTNVGGADTVFPFSSGIDVSDMILVHSKQGSNAAMSSTYTATEKGTYLAICFSAGNTTKLNPSVTTTGNILASITTAASTANQAKIAINFIELNANETVTGADPNATTSGRAAFVVYQLK